MGMDLFDLKATLKLDSSDYENGISDAKSSAESFSTWAVAKGQLLGNAIWSGAKMAVNGVKSLVQIGTDYNTQMETYTTNFTTMLGSTEAAVAKVEELKKFAASTPLSMDDLSKGTQTLLAFGVASDDSTTILRQLGDIALGDSQKMQSLATAFGKVQASGKLTGETVQQMIAAGWNPLIQISQTTGETMEEVQKRMSQGAISVEELQQAMEAVTTGSGQFAGGMESASHTTAGLISTLQDNAKALVGEVFKPISEGMLNNLLPGAINAISTLTNAYKNDGIKGMFKAGSEIIKQAISAFTNALPEMMNTGLEFISAILDGIMGAMPNLIEGAFTIVQTLAEYLADNIDSILQTGYDLLLWLVQGIAEALPELVPVLTDIILSIVTFLTDPSHVSQILETVALIMSAVAEALINAFPVLLSGLLTILGNVIASVYEWVVGLPQVALDAIANFIDGLLGGEGDLDKTIDDLISSMLGVFDDAWEDMKEAGRNLLVGLWNGINDKVEWLKGKVKGVVDTIKGWFTGKDGFDEHSPSKWSKKVFEYLVEGGVQGLDASAPDLYRTVGGIVDSTKGMFDLGGMTSVSSDASASASNLKRFGGYTQTINFNYPMQAPDEVANEIKFQSTYGLAGEF